MGRSTNYTLRYDYSGAPERLSWSLVEGDIMKSLDGSYLFAPSATNPGVDRRHLRPERRGRRAPAGVREAPRRGAHLAHAVGAESSSRAVVPRVLLLTGKGGVGKTTTAAATALRCAALGHRTLVLSTDPAHSLADAFGVPLGAQPSRIAPKLCGPAARRPGAARGVVEGAAHLPLRAVPVGRRAGDRGRGARRCSRGSTRSSRWATCAITSTRASTTSSSSTARPPRRRFGC